MSKNPVISQADEEVVSISHVFTLPQLLALIRYGIHHLKGRSAVSPHFQHISQFIPLLVEQFELT